MVDSKIRNIEVIPLQVPLDRTYHGSHYQMTHRCAIITRIHTDSGVVGEAYNGDEYETQAEIARIIRSELLPLVVGQPAGRPELLWQRMRVLTADILRDRGLVLQAIAAVDSANWDVFGKLADLPLSRVFGGYRDELPIIAIGGYYARPGEREEDAIEAEFAAYRDLQLAGVKFKVGKLSPEDDARRIRFARRLMGDEFLIAADANQAWSLREAVRFAQLAEDTQLAWFEEPCRWENDRLAMRDVRMITGLPVTAGQSERSRAGCRDLMASGAIDICNFDASWGGGPTEWRRVALMASAYGVSVGHHEEPQIAAHLLAGIPNGTYLECFHPNRDPLFFNLIANRPAIRNGIYPVPTGRGWGIALDEDYVQRYRVDA